MKLKNELISMKKWILLILIAIFAYWGLSNFGIISGAINKVFAVLLPFILGGVMAFILNIPMTKTENVLKKRIKKKDKLVRGISIVLSLLLFVLIIAFIAFLLIPELINNANMLIKNIPGFVDKVEVFVLDLLDKYPEIQIKIEEIFANSGNTDIISNILNYFVNGAIGFVSSLVSGFVTFFTGIIFSVYLLSQKEYIVRGSKKVIHACFNEKLANKILDIGVLANKTFSNFISGQCLEAFILGFLMFIVLSIFRLPYALIISVLTAVTALIPIFGAFIAMAVGVILIAITEPLKAIIFIVIFLVVQQVEGNFIYPKVVGKSVGLSPMWTLFAITVGGNLFGIVGMIIGLPLASMIYAITVGIVNDKLKEKKIKIS